LRNVIIGTSLGNKAVTYTLLLQGLDIWECP
jgi:hypothetical protein